MAEKALKLLAHRAHAASSFNRAAIETGARCGCFYCVKVFSPKETPIKEWIDYQRTALCPFCSIDSVVSSADIEKVTEVGFLKLMEAKWFGDLNEESHA